MTLFFISIVIAFHAYAFLMESVLWQTPRARKAFGTTSEFAAASKSLAFNQGVYNLFLVAGLIWSLLASEPTAYQAKLFFLGCVLVAALAVGLSSSKRLMLVQGTPALIALLLVLASHNHG